MHKPSDTARGPTPPADLPLWNAGPMDGWMIGLIVLLIVGLSVIAYGALSDRRRHRRAVTQLLSPPARRIPQLPPDSPAPAYLSSLQARREPADPRPQPTDRERAAIDRDIHDSATTRVRAGFASDAFVTDRADRRCILTSPRILLVTDSIMTVRELITVLEHMISDGTPLVIIAANLAPDVLDTLEVNHLQRRADLLAVVSRDPAVTGSIAGATGATPVTRVDLQTAAVTDGDLGRCRRWISDHDRSWIVTTPSERESVTESRQPDQA